MSLGYLQGFINEQEKQTMKDETERGTCAGLREFGGHLDHRKSREHGKDTG